MDRTTGHQDEITLAELAAGNRTVTIRRDNRAPLIVTARSLMAEGRISGCLTLDQLEWAFSGAGLPKRERDYG